MTNKDSEILVIEGKNPVTEAVRSGESILELMVLKGDNDLRLSSLVREAKARGDIRITYVDKDKLTRLSPGGRHQGVIALAEGFKYVDTDAILQRAAEQGEDPFIVVLDGVEDPHNVGAVVRTADQCGVHGIILREHRAAGMTTGALRSAAGAASYMPIARVNNIVRTIAYLKEQGLWIAAADMSGRSIYESDLSGPICLVIGGERSGVSPLVLKHSDLSVSIPMRGHIDSLNASVAAGLIMYEVYRTRLKSPELRN